MKKLKLQRERGFTLIELMITVVIVGVLAAVAVPAYQDYVAKSQVSEAFSLVSGGKPAVGEYFANHGAWPATMADAGYNGANGKFISSTTIGTDGQIVATFSNEAYSKISGKTLTLIPKQESPGNVSWGCTSTADPKYLPKSCQPPAQTPPFSGTINYTISLKIVDGVIYYGRAGNVAATVDKTDLDGTVHASGSSGTKYVLHTDGTLEAINPNGTINRYNPDKSTTTIAPNLSPDGKQVTIFNLNQNSPYYNTTEIQILMSNVSQLYAPFYTDPTPANYQNLMNANQAALNYLSQFKDANGNWPADMDKSVIDYANGKVFNIKP